MTLYDINQQMEEAINRMFAEANENDGEVSQETTDLIAELQITKDEKIEAIGCKLKNFDAEIEALKNEEESLKERRKSKESKREGLASYVAKMLGGENWDKSSKVEFSFRKSEQTIIDDETLIPDEYFKIKTDVKPDLTAIKKAIKAGELTEGAHIANRINMTVK